MLANGLLSNGVFRAKLQHLFHLLILLSLAIASIRHVLEPQLSWALGVQSTVLLIAAVAPWVKVLRDYVDLFFAVALAVCFVVATRVQDSLVVPMPLLDMALVITALLRGRLLSYVLATTAVMAAAVLFHVPFWGDTFFAMQALAALILIVVIVEMSQLVAQFYDANQLSLSRQLVATEDARSNERQARDASDKASTFKSRFLSTMSHEIRTPLNTMVGLIHLLRASGLTAEQQEDVRAIEVASKHLLGLINDILDFSKIEAGEFELDEHDFSLSELLDDIHKLFSANAASKSLRFDVVNKLPAKWIGLHGDGLRLRQILVNLLGNALKFTQQGSVTLTVTELSGQEGLQGNEGTRWLRFEVRDTGSGIPERLQEKLFQPFTQADSSISREFGGTGLGLSIVSHLCRIMGGRVGVESEVGVGSAFRVNLPLAIVKNFDISAQTVRPGHALRVLVVDDDPEDLKVLIQLARDFGWDIQGVSSGQNALEVVHQSISAGTPLDCIVLDWRMPTMNGVQTIEHLSADVDVEHMPSVIMLTSDDRSALSRAMGTIQPDGILTKPVDPSVLFNAVNEAVVARSHEFTRVLEGTDVEGYDLDWLHNICVLVVDDNHMNLQVVERVLIDEGALVVCAGSGHEALDILRRRESDFDLVLMDVQMPEMDGYQTTEKIRRELGLDTLPVIALTAGASAAERDEALAAGMQGFLIKPLQISNLIRVLRQHVESVRGRPVPVAVTSQGHGRSFQTEPMHNRIDSSTPPSALRPQIDRQAAREALSGQIDMLPELLSTMVKSNHGLVAALQAQLSAGDRESVKARVHTLKGQASYVGALQLSEAASALNRILNTDSENWEQAWAELSRCYTLFEQEVQADYPQRFQSYGHR